MMRQNANAYPVNIVLYICVCFIFFYSGYWKDYSWCCWCCYISDVTVTNVYTCINCIWLTNPRLLPFHCPVYLFLASTYISNLLIVHLRLIFCIVFLSYSIIVIWSQLLLIWLYEDYEHVMYMYIYLICTI